MKRNYTNIALAAGLILVAALARIVNREMGMFNLAPVAAVGLFSGAVIKDKRLSYLMPLLAMFIADVYFQLFTKVQGFYGQEQWFVYGGMVLVTLLGTFLKNRNALNVLAFSLAGSGLFFLVSNFGSYLSGMYGQGFNAMVTTYTMAIPFFKNTVASDLVWNTVLFGVYFLAQRSLEAKAQKA
jgi:hypothetical protein